MPTFDPVPRSSASLVFDSCSDGVITPHEQLSSAAPSFAIDAAKGIASAGVAVHSPPARFVGTPFATGPNTLFEYPFPPARPSLSTTSSISSVASSVLGPPSPSTRAKYIPRISQQPPKRFSANGTPQVRIPPRLRTDSGGSAASNQSHATDESASAKTPRTAPSAYTQRTPLRLARLRDRSGSLGVLPIQLPPPTIAAVGVGVPSAGPMSPAMFVGAMASTGFAMPMTPLSGGEAGPDEAAAAPGGKRRASVPALFAPRMSEGSGSDSGLDREDMDDHPGPPTLAPET